MQFIDAVRTRIRSVVRLLAKQLNVLTRGHLHPDAVTIFGFVMHIPTAVLIALGSYNLLAAALLVIFGLFDTLDGELARLQKRESNRGGLLDAATDRMKEVLLYTGAAYVLAAGQRPVLAVWAVAACGASLSVSYVKAKGEAIVASLGTAVPYAKLNYMFKDGLLTFEVRMVVLILGLITSRLTLSLIVIAVLSTMTALQRLVKISKAL